MSTGEFEHPYYFVLKVTMHGIPVIVVNEVFLFGHPLNKLH